MTDVQTNLRPYSVKYAIYPQEDNVNPSSELVDSSSYLVITFLSVDFVAGLLDAEGEDLVLSLGDGPQPETDRLVGVVQLDVLGRTLVQPLQTGQVELDELLALVPG